MLDWMREITAYCLTGNEIDAEDFHLGFDSVLPPEMQDLLSGRKLINPATKAKCDLENAERILDEHELALG